MDFYTKYFTLVILTLCVYQSRSQNVVFHGNNEEDIANSIVQYEYNFFIVGTTRKDHKRSTNYYVLQLHSNGSLKKEFVFGNTHYDIGKDIIVDEDGIYVLGQTWDGGYGNNDMFLHKLNHEGDKKWSEFYGGPNNELGHKFIKTKDGGFSMAGHNRSLDDFGDAYLVKSNSEGEIIWESHFGERYVDHGFDVIENSNGEFLLIGTMGGFFVANCCDFQNPDADIFIVKTNSLGEKIWEKTYGGDGHDWAKEIIAAPNGGYFVCGSTQSEGAGSFDFFLLKIDENGNQLWFKTYGGTDFDYGESLGLNKEQNLYILGSSASFSDNFKPDHYLIKTNLEGEIIWTKTFGGEGSDYSSALICTSDSGCVFTGTTSNGSLGNKDIVFYKISKTGEALVVSAIPPINDSIEQISVYPNPVQNKFSVFIETKINTNFQINIYNATGQKVYQQQVATNVRSWHQPKLNRGLYLYTIQNKNKVVFNGKLVFTN